MNSQLIKDNLIFVWGTINLTMEKNYNGPTITS